MSLPKRAAGITLAATLTLPVAASTLDLRGSSQAEATTTVAAVERAPAPSPRANRAAARAALSERTIKVASRYKGVPYRFGGTTPRGFDCSGYTRFVFAKLHKKLPRTSQQQFNAAHRVKHPRVGDLLFYHSGSRNGPVYHVVIYAGHSRVWHAPNPGTRVKRGKIYAQHWTAGRF
ncbi:C40 family peptidase [Sporichthya sp.]|uniref:C40 family peptidase n=1 Tax=Sporichthya sp. TaxID=65475 RepID=UPI0017B357DF|nr:C40 family peptidase [Sporichthya sp.]MBA3742816.1 C40 family peptidase [Sporichthya sp.]